MGGRRMNACAAEPPRWADDSLIDIADIRRIFKLGRTAAYELTRRPDFPAPVPISSRCYRWWASEVAAFAATLRQQPAQASTRHPRRSPVLPGQAAAPRRIIGTVRPARNRKDPQDRKEMP